MVSAAHLAPFGHFAAATFLGMRTTGIETTARGWIDRAWNLTFELLRVSANVGIKRGNCRQQRASVRVSGFRKQFVRRRRLDDLSKVHDCDKVTGVRDDAQIMADKQEGNAALPLNRVEQVEHVGLY